MVSARRVCGPVRIHHRQRVACTATIPSSAILSKRKCFPTTAPCRRHECVDMMPLLAPDERRDTGFTILPIPLQNPDLIVTTI